jgi:hypothetical protein
MLKGQIWQRNIRQTDMTYVKYKKRRIYTDGHMRRTSDRQTDK